MERDFVRDHLGPALEALRSVSRGPLETLGICRDYRGTPVQKYFSITLGFEDGEKPMPQPPQLKL